MISVIASVLASALLVIGGMWMHMGVFDTLKAQVNDISEQRFGISTYVPVQGGTGTSTSPVAGDILTSFANNVYGPTALYAGSNVTLSTSTYRRLTISLDTTGLATFGFPWTTETLNGQLGNSTSTLLRMFGGAHVSNPVTPKSAIP